MHTKRGQRGLAVRDSATCATCQRFPATIKLNRAANTGRHTRRHAATLPTLCCSCLLRGWRCGCRGVCRSARRLWWERLHARVAQQRNGLAVGRCSSSRRAAHAQAGHETQVGAGASSMRGLHHRATGSATTANKLCSSNPFAARTTPAHLLARRRWPWWRCAA